MNQVDDLENPWPAELPRRRDGDRTWPAQASAWLATVVPPDLAHDPDLRTDPRLLCTLARHHVAGRLLGCRESWRRITKELEDAKVLPEVRERVLASTVDEGRHLAELEQQLATVRVALAAAAWGAVPYKKRSGGG